MKIFSPMKKAAFLFARALIAFALVLLASGVQAQRPVDSADLRTKINQWVITNGAKQITAVQINNLFNGVADLMTQYSFDSAYRINDTLFLAGPKLATFKITLKPGSVTAVSGTANRITSSGGSTPAIDISATFEALLGKVANRIDQNNALTTSLQLSGVISDETGSGPLVFSVSPTFTGTPLAPTAAPGTNTTQIASAAFVTAAVTAGAYTLPAATTSIRGGVKPDGTTITIVGDVISASGGGGSSMSIQTITSGSSGTVTGTNYTVWFNPASALSTYTLTLPASPVAGQFVRVGGGGTITSGNVLNALFIAPNSGQSILDNTPPAGSPMLVDDGFLYEAITTTLWKRWK